MRSDTAFTPDNIGHEGAKEALEGLFAPENQNVTIGPEDHAGQRARWPVG